MLSYAGNTPKTTGQTVSKESIDQLFRNLIIILNHFFEYGFIRSEKPMVDTDFDSLNTNEEARPATHYWDLISKYFSYYSSVSYINSQLEDVEPGNKALTWLILVLNENGLLYYCFQLIFTNGSFLAHYHEDTSYMHLHRQQLLGISQNIYAHKLFVANVQHQRYQEYLDKALRERIKSNSEFFSGQHSDSKSVNDGYGNSRSL